MSPWHYPKQPEIMRKLEIQGRTESVQTIYYCDWPEDLEESRRNKDLAITQASVTAGRSHKYLRDDVNRIYRPRKNGGRGLAGVEDSVGASIERLEDNMQKRGARLITDIRNNTDNMRTNRMTITRKQNLE